jgi:AraC-like DNA-binding protein
MERCFIKSIWRLHEFNIQERTETILPKGTVEIIFNLSDDIVYCNSTLDIRKKLPSCFINGINFNPFNLIKSGQQVFLGIQLNSLGLKALFNVPVKEFNNIIIEGALVSRSLNTLLQQLVSNRSFNEQVHTIMKWIYRRVSVSNYYNDIKQMHALFYSRCVTELSVKQLCDEAYLSDRHLRRLSADWLGMSTETFILYNKYYSSLRLLHTSDLSLTEIGLEAGYYDQAHFIREFKSFTDLTPKEYRKARSEFIGHYYVPT